MNPTIPEQKARVLIVDDHPAVREALSIRINGLMDLIVCGEAATIPETLNLVETTEPDVVVLDLSLGSADGLDLIKRIKHRNGSIRILVWSMYSELLYAERALRAGALGYVSKEQATEQIVEAIRRVLEGKVWLSETMSERLVKQRVIGAKRESSEAPVEALTDRELKVFLLIGEGVKTAEIARRLHLSVKTVETYRDRIRQKLDLEDGTRLAHFATRWALEHR